MGPSPESILQVRAGVNNLYTDPHTHIVVNTLMGILVTAYSHSGHFPHTHIVVTTRILT